MSNFTNDTQTFSQSSFKKKWVSEYQFLNKESSGAEIVKSVSEFDRKNLLFNELVIVNHEIDFKPIFVSKNIVEILGYTPEEFLAMGSQAYFRLSALDQPDFWDNMMKWGLESRKCIPKSSVTTKGREYFCGISTVCKDGSVKRFLIRNEKIYGENLESGVAIILYFEDITHFFKGNEYWMFFKHYTDKGIISQFQNASGIHNSLITEREKDVLKLIAAGKTSKEVAEILYISPETVSQHRKNMLKRTNAKDTSALIHFCKVCEIF